ncbi:uncharacterized protein FIBRA_02518 [Fibroporia radiculosa]|uniref:F-box domain-containing protein n=1 Tax=Fibroporia radiculosa TaxID=599839 RepID=J4H1W5_9APHY|nr:uncharacterized protein FIBRA_02518 [Fibroporia radiculosa]CCM00484.1 predicted protein [Fibroporia radiculosa]
MEQLWDDRSALFACSLTCRAWLPRARTLIQYAYVNITSYNEYTQIEKMLKKRPVIAQFIRHISISKPRASGSRSNRVDREWPLLLQRLPAVEFLMLRNWSSCAMSNAALKNLHLSLSRIRTLSVVYSELTTQRTGNHSRFTEPIARLVCACPQLTSLKLSHKLRRSSESPNVQDPHLHLANVVPAWPIHIESLEIAGVAVPLDYWLLRGPIHLAPRRLLLQFSNRTGLYHIEWRHAGYLRQAGAALRELVLVFEFMWRLQSQSDPRLNACFSLVENEHLETLHLQYNCGNHEVGVREFNLEYAASALSHIPTHSHHALRHVRITFKLSTVVAEGIYNIMQLSPEVASGWAVLDDALSLFIRRRPQTEVEIEIYDEHPQGSLTAGYGTVVFMMIFLTKVQAVPHRVKIIYGRKWDPSADFGGRTTGELLEHWLE